MTEPEADSIPSDPCDAAGYWHARLHSGQATPQDHQRFEQWLQASPEHERQYRNVEQIWQASLLLSRQGLGSVPARSRVNAQPASPSRRRFGFGMAGACTAALLGGVAVHQGWLQSPTHVLELAVARGDRQQWVLPDDSVLNGNTGTRAEVRLYKNQRVVKLLEGEMFFAVAPDAQRPFIVEAGDSRVVVTGTRFNVRRDADAVRVGVESGSVEVSNGPWWQSQVRALRRGQGVAAVAGQGLGEIERVDIEQVTAWQRGKIIFENTPLEQAIAEINRYLPQPARLVAPALRNYRVVGVINVDNPRMLLDILPEVVPVQVLYLPDGQARIVAR